MGTVLQFPIRKKVEPEPEPAGWPELQAAIEERVRHSAPGMRLDPDVARYISHRVKNDVMKTIDRFVETTSREQLVRLIGEMLADRVDAEIGFEQVKKDFLSEGER